MDVLRFIVLERRMLRVLTYIVGITFNRESPMSQNTCLSAEQNMFSLPHIQKALHSIVQTSVAALADAPVVQEWAVQRSLNLFALQEILPIGYVNQNSYKNCSNDFMTILQTIGFIQGATCLFDACIIVPLQSDNLCINTLYGISLHKPHHSVFLSISQEGVLIPKFG